MKYRQQFFYTMLMWLIYPFMKLFYGFEVHGLENIPPDNRYIICANHSSNADPLLLIMTFKKKIFFMAKQELFKNKLFGWFLKKVGVFPVHRGSKDTNALDISHEVLENNKPLGMFIEGTRSKNGEFLKPKAGAVLISYDAKATILPVCITNKNKGPVKIFNKTSIDIGKPINWKELSIKVKKSSELRAAIRKVMNEIIQLRNDMWEREENKKNNTC